jgi:eukaryotic-like serine/threonine-protein kinase
MEGAPAHASLIGATIGNYRVVAKLGEGGMGAVYLAEHPLIGKKVALKVLHEEYAANQDVITRFFNEAKAVNDIGHPNIVDIIDYGVVQTPHGVAFVYFIMEFLAGESLAQVIQREAPLPPERALHIAMQVADALAASHAKGIVHRDLKPDNIYLLQRARERDFVKVLDFGIAKLTGEQGGSRRTRTGIVMGTPAYMSPEQCEGRGNIDHRTDIYALGILLYEMITGRVPFVGEGYGEVLVQHLTKVPARPSTIRGVIPASVEAIVMKALEKPPEARFQTMEQFIEAMRNPQVYVDMNGGLGAFMPQGAGMPQNTLAMPPGSQPGLYQGQPTLQRPTTLSGSAGQVGGSRRVSLIAVAAVLLAALGVGGAVALFGGKKGNNAVADPAATGPGKDSSGKTDGEAKDAKATKVTKADVPPVVTKPAETETKPPVATTSSTAVVPPPVENVTSSAAPPPPPVVPEAPKTVAIQVASVPQGADVYLGDEPAPRGKTPFKFTVPRASGDVELTFKLPGYKPKKRSVKSSADGDYEIALEKDRTAPPPPARVDYPPPRHNPADTKKPPPPTDTVKKPPDSRRPDKKIDDDDVLPPSF